MTDKPLTLPGDARADDDTCEVCGAPCSLIRRADGELEAFCDSCGERRYCPTPAEQAADCLTAIAAAHWHLAWLTTQHGADGKAWAAAVRQGGGAGFDAVMARMYARLGQEQEAIGDAIRPGDWARRGLDAAWKRGLEPLAAARLHAEWRARRAGIPFASKRETGE